MTQAAAGVGSPTGVAVQASFSADDRKRKIRVPPNFGEAVQFAGLQLDTHRFRLSQIGIFEIAASLPSGQFEDPGSLL